MLFIQFIIVRMPFIALLAWSGLVNCCWSTPAQSFLGLGPVRSHDHIFLSRYSDSWHLLKVGFEVLTAVIMKSTILWDVTVCSLLIVDVSESSACHLLSRWFLAHLIFPHWRWRRYVPPKRWLTFNGLHSVISQKMVLFVKGCIHRIPWNVYCR
jgi:hypothetical protein